MQSSPIPPNPEHVEPQVWSVRHPTPLSDCNTAAINQNVHMEQLNQDWDDTHMVSARYTANQSKNENIGSSASEEERGATLYTSLAGPAFVAASEARNFALNLVGNTTTTKIALNDVYDTDVESVSLIEAVGNSVHSRPAVFPKDRSGVPALPPSEDILDFCLALGLWCDKEGITRRAYQGLTEVLSLVKEVDEAHTIPRYLSTLQKKCRRWLPLPHLHKTVVAVKSVKQPTGLANSSQSSMYFFDLRTLVATALSASKGRVFHTGIADIVDNPSEYWHSRS